MNHRTEGGAVLGQHLAVLSLFGREAQEMAVLISWS